jgi:hypothetical protein
MGAKINVLVLLICEVSKLVQPNCIKIRGINRNNKKKPKPKLKNKKKQNKTKTKN